MLFSGLQTLVVHKVMEKAKAIQLSLLLTVTEALFDIIPDPLVDSL